MKRHFYQLMSGLVILMALMGCTVEKIVNEGTVKSKKITAGDSVIAIKADAVFFEIVNNSRADGGSIVVPSVPQEIKKVIITISGINIPAPIEYNLVKIDDVWQGIIGNVPAGPATVVGKAYDANDTMLYQSQVDITVENHGTLNLNLNMIPLSPPPGYNVKAPRIDLVNISPNKVAPNDIVRLEVIAHDPEPSGPLTYIWTPQNVGSFNDRTSPNPLWTAPATEGIYQLTITVIDQEYLIDHFTISIDVNNKYGNGTIPIVIGVNNFPVIYSIVADPTRIDKGESTQLTVDAYDPDGNNLTYAWTADCAGTFSDETVIDPVFTVDAAVPYGTCTLTVSVSDGSLTTIGSIMIHISDDPLINTPPVVISCFQSAKIVSANGILNFSAKARDPESSIVTFVWKCDAGTFSNQSDTMVAQDYQSEVVWTAPATTQTAPIMISIEAIDESGLSTTVDFLPVTMK